MGKSRDLNSGLSIPGPVSVPCADYGLERGRPLLLQQPQLCPWLCPYARAEGLGRGEVSGSP